MDDVTQRLRSRVRFTATAVGIVVVGVAGYLGFLVFAGSDPDVGTGVAVLAAATGFAAFFSPCSFPLLLTFLTRRSAESRRAALASASRVGAGAAVLLGLLATVVAAGGTAFGAVLELDSAAGRIFRFGVGLLLVVFGLRQAQLLGLQMRWLDRVAGSAGRLFDPSRVSSSAGSDFVYGFGYVLAGFG